MVKHGPLGIFWRSCSSRWRFLCGRYWQSASVMYATADANFSISTLFHPDSGDGSCDETSSAPSTTPKKNFWLTQTLAIAYDVLWPLPDKNYLKKTFYLKYMAISLEEVTNKG